MKGLVAVIIASYLSFGSLKAQDTLRVNVPPDKIFLLEVYDDRNILSEYFITNHKKSKMVEFVDINKDGSLDNISIYDFENNDIVTLPILGIFQHKYEEYMHRYFPREINYYKRRIRKT